MGLLLTQVFKVMVGRLRPNFLARCQPLVPPNAVFSLQNLTAAMQPANQYPCSDTGLVKEGRLSFPSGAPRRRSRSY
jgi:phosphatidate phosphatase